jgi:hypothetical protein
LQRSKRHHHQLVGGLGFKLRELLRERRSCCRIEYIGFIHHPAAERRQNEGNGRNRGKQDKNEER